MIPPLPSGSMIQVEREGGGFLLTFHTSRTMHLVRWGVVAFLIFWLCGWAMGEVFALGALFSGGTPWPVKLFLLVWVVFWTIGGLAAICFTIGFAQTPRTETLLVEPDTLTWTPPYRWLAVTRKKAGLLRHLYASLVTRDPFLRIPRAEILSIALEQTDSESTTERLHIHRGDETYFIGSTLNETEARWLHGILDSWHVAGQ